MKQLILVVAMVLYANIAKANEIDEYIVENYSSMPADIQQRIDELLEYGDRYKHAIFAIIHSQKVYNGNPSCHDMEEV
jgi:hypothetical protein|tara:strand:- start:80 stop:313 length:234 start_codon:yes stop_codon:yes gene_type:complete